MQFVNFMKSSVSNLFERQKILDFSENLLEALAIFLFFYLITFIVKFISSNIRKRISKEKQSVIFLIRKIINSFIILSAIIAALNHMGVDVRIFVLELGLAGFAISFAFKDALSNILSGVIIILYRPFLVSDYIKVGNIQGKVRKIDLRHTTIEGSGERYLIPNAKLISENITVQEKKSK